MRGAAVGLYRSLLFVLPAPLRERHGDEMVQLFADLQRDVRLDRGRLASLRFSAGSILRLALAGVGSRLGALGPGSPSPRPTDPRFRERLVYGFVRDLRFGARTLIQSPGYAAVVVVTLALAIGVNTSIYSIVSMLLDPPLPYQAMDELVNPISRNTELNRAMPAVSQADLEDLVARSPALQSGGGLFTEAVALTGADEPVRATAGRVTLGYFPMLGVEPVLGRRFAEGEDLPGRDRVVLLGESAWERWFAADPEAVGSQVSLDGLEHTVVGVMPRALELSGGADLYRPLAGEAATHRDQRNLWAIARLAPGATLEQARAEVEEISAALQAEFPDSNAGWNIQLRSLHEAMVGPNAPVVFTLMTVAVGFVLLIACANVAGLTLARAHQRARELSLRAALGAGRSSLVRTLLTESLLLALMAGALGLVVTRYIFAGLRFIAGGQMSLFEQLRLDPGVLGFTFALALATPLLFGLWPALRACRRDLHLSLRDGGSAGQGRDVQRARRLMVVAQVAMAVTLLIVAGLATRSMGALLAIELGFDPDRLMSFRLTLTPDSETEPAVRFAALRQELAALPGVRSVGLSSVRPIVRSAPSANLWIDGSSFEQGHDRTSIEVVVADPELFDTLGLTLLRGRGIDPSDGTDDLPVAVLGRAAAERFWPDAEPLGERLRVGDDSGPWLRVVGVVSDVRNADADQPAQPRVYLPLAQSAPTTMAFLVRTEGEPGEMAEAMREAVWRVDPRQPVDDMRTMERIRVDDFAGDLAMISLLAFFALVAFALSVAGVYSIVTYSVSRRTREIGIRMAVGARAPDVRRLVTRQGLVMVGSGAAIGLAAGFLLSRLMTGMLYGVSSFDPITFVGVPLTLLAVGILAAALPANRATRLDPARTLRAD